MNPVANDPAVTARPGPGAQLRQARSDRGLEVSQVAQRLRLAPGLIEAIERDEFARLPGATYARGYLRAYAGLLGISPEPLLEAHARLSDGGTAANLGKLAIAEQVTSGHRHIRWTTYLVIAVVFGLALAWWQARESQRRAAIVATPPGSVQPVDEPDALVPDASNGAAPLLPAPRPVAVGSLVRAEPPAAVSGTASLTLHAEEECWADIRDADDRRLLYETLPAGRTVSLQGVPPFSVYLGNAGGVRVEFNGQVQDIGRFRRGPVARFRLGASGAIAGPEGAP